MFCLKQLMSFIERYCPEAVVGCIRMFLLHFTKKGGKKRKNQSNGIEELEQEEFQFTPSSNRFNHQQQKQVNIHPKESQKSHEEQDDNLNFKLNLRSRSEGETEQTSKLYQAQAQLSYKLSNFNFKLNLEPYDPYYSLLEGKTKNIPSLFETSTKNILTRNVKSLVKIQQIQTISGFKMLITYRLPSSYAYYKNVNRNHQITSKINPVFASYKIVEAIHSNLTINYLSFKKFMLLQPRFFNYLKYQNSTHNFHWQICTSVKGRPEAESTEKQCELTSISCFEERKGQLIVNTYLQIDLKSNLRASKVVLRVYQQLATYLDNLYDYLAENACNQEV